VINSRFVVDKEEMGQVFPPSSWVLPCQLFNLLPRLGTVSPSVDAGLCLIPP